MIDVENEGSGTPPLTVPGLIWEDPLRKYAGWRPTREWKPEPDPRADWRRDRARELLTEALAQIDGKLITAAGEARTAAESAVGTLRALEQEQRELEANQEPDEQQAVRQLVIKGEVKRARQQAETTGSTYAAALEVLRGALVFHVDHIVVARENAAARALDEEADRLQEQAGDRRLAVHDTRSLCNGYLPEPIPAADAPKKRGLFR
jgi:hypothetical protein